MVDLRGRHPRIPQRQLHGHGHLHAVLLGDHHVVGLARRGIPRHLRIDAGLAPERVAEGFQHQHARALAHHEAVAGAVEGARRARGRVVERGREGAERAEAREGQRREARVGAARDDHVRPAGADAGERLADGMGAGRAGGGDGLVDALGSKGDRHDPRRRVQGDHRDEVRVDAVGTEVPVELGELLFADHHAAHAGAHDDAHPVRVLALQLEPGIVQRLPRRQQRELRVAVEALDVDARG